MPTWQEEVPEHPGSRQPPHARCRCRYSTRLSRLREWERLKPAIGTGDIRHIGGSPQTLHTRTCFGASRTGGTGVTRLAPPQPCYRSHTHSRRGLVLAPCHACRSTGAILLHAPGRTVTASIATAPVTRCRRADKARAARPIPSCFQAFAPLPRPGRPGCPCGGRCEQCLTGSQGRG